MFSELGLVEQWRGARAHSDSNICGSRVAYDMKRGPNTYVLFSTSSEEQHLAFASSTYVE